MLFERKILAVVPARSGSKGIRDKNMCEIGGVSLIGHAGRCLTQLPWIDRAIISTDSQRYAQEGEKYGLAAPFLRPAELSGDSATAVDTMAHALISSEEYFQCSFDIVLIVEPTSPLRLPEDIEGAARLLVASEADSVVTVSVLPEHYHPLKILALENDCLAYYDEDGGRITARQQLPRLYIRNGACYALTRHCLLEQRRIITGNTKSYCIERTLTNIDSPTDFEWGEYLYRKAHNRT